MSGMVLPPQFPLLYRILKLFYVFVFTYEIEYCSFKVCSCYWHKNRYVDKWNGIKDPDINPYTYEHLTFYKEAKCQNGKKKASFTNDTGITGCQHVKDCK